MNEEAAALRTLVADGIADAELLAHASLLVDAGVPILISGPSDTLTTRVADAFALASPVPGAAQSGRDIEIACGHHIEWLADPTGIG